MIRPDILPPSYRQHMEEQLKGEYAAYLESLDKPFLGGLRVNTKKISPQELMEAMGISLRPVPWTENGFYTCEGISFSKHPYYYAGLYYLQEPSAMAPCGLLAIDPGDKVLDLCAAPGGKSTQAGIQLSDKGMLLANDVSSSRAKALLKNIELFGIGNSFICSALPAELSVVYEGYFDKILVDAPCSGEGMFRRDPAVFKAYLQRGPEYFVPIQKDILRQAARMLRPGGRMMYSTCTYSVLEDEEIIFDFLSEFPEFSTVPLAEFDGFFHPAGLPDSIKLFPHRVEGEGHFIVCLQKEEDGGFYPELDTYYSKKLRLPSDFYRFLDGMNRFWDHTKFFVQGDYIYYLPSDARIKKTIRYLRTGLLMGRMNHDRFEPSQALAMHLRNRYFCIQQTAAA